MTLQEIKDAVESWVAPRLPTLINRQNQYFANKGRYFQGIKTPVNIPVDGAEEVPDGSLKPTDQAESWNDVSINWPASVPAQLICDVYDGPQGKGWTFSCRVRVNSRVYIRTLNFGPEEYRQTQGWDLEDPDA
jgi:hypothetical protein